MTLQFHQSMWDDAPTAELLSMLDLHHNTDNPMGSHMINTAEWNCPALKAFMGHAMDVLIPISGREWKMMVYAVITPPSDEEWAYGYPHTHSYAYHSLVHYLAPGAAKAPLVLFDKDFGPTEVEPVTGKTVIFTADTEHGVVGSESTDLRKALVVQTMSVKVRIH